MWRSKGAWISSYPAFRHPDLAPRAARAHVRLLYPETQARGRHEPSLDFDDTLYSYPIPSAAKEHHHDHRCEGNRPVRRGQRPQSVLRDSWNWTAADPAARWAHVGRDVRTG